MLYFSRLLFILCSFILLGAAAPPKIKKVSEQSPRGKIMSIVAGEWLTKGIYTAIELNIADYLTEGPKNVQELAKLTQCHEESLYRLLRMLASEDVFRESKPRVFCNTPASALLTKSQSDSLRSLVLFNKNEIISNWNKLTDCVREGKTAFELTHGKTKLNYFEDNPKTAEQWKTAKNEKAKTVIFACLKAFDFGRFKSVYDIGGGTGHFLIALLKKYPFMNGVLYELPEVISEAKKPIVQFERCSLLAGDFFKTVPVAGDAYILKSVLHNWTDKAALKILANCHQAMSDTAKLIIIEPIITFPNRKELSKLVDVYTMLTTGGRERTLQEFQDLIDQSGFVIESITPTDLEFYLIEARKKTIALPPIDS